MKKKIIIILIIGFGLGLGYAYYAFNKTHGDMQDRKAVATLSAEELYNQFSLNESEANKSYIGKVVEVKGTVYSIEQNEQNDLNVLLMEDGAMFGVSCNVSITEDNNNLKEGDPVLVKGECSGFLNDVVLIRCIIKKRKDEK